MTLITVQDGKPVIKDDGKIGTEQACCCDCCCKCVVKVTFPGIFEDGEYVKAAFIDDQLNIDHPCGQPGNDARIDFVCEGANFLQTFGYSLVCDNSNFTLTVDRITPCVPEFLGGDGVSWRVTDVYTFGCNGGEPVLVSSTEEIQGDIDNQCPCGKETGADYTIDVDCNPLP